jgi:hypothetical protein
MSKKSVQLADNVMRRKITVIVQRYSQNGYISFQSLQNVFNNLKVTEIAGNEAAIQQLKHIQSLDIGIVSEIGKSKYLII